MSRPKSHSSFRVRFPVTAALRHNVERFPALIPLLGDLSADRDARQIVRALSDLHDERLEKLVTRLHQSASRWPDLIASICSQTSGFQFRQKLAELHLLHWLLSKGVDAEPIPAAKGARHADIEMAAGALKARVELYTPVESTGLWEVEETVTEALENLDGAVPLNLKVALRVLKQGSVKTAQELGTQRQLERWLEKIRADASAWIRRAPKAGEMISVTGPNKTAVVDIHVGDPGPSGEITNGSPEQLAGSSWGQKVYAKLRRAQCGDDWAVLRILAINLAELETGIHDSMAGALRILAQKAGIPYDAAVLCELGHDVVATPLIVLNAAKTAAITALNAILSPPAHVGEPP